MREEKENTMNKYKKTKLAKLLKTGYCVRQDSFAEACVDSNTVFDLVEAISYESADTEDMNAWQLTAREWREEIWAALCYMISERDELDIEHFGHGWYRLA